MGMKSPRDSTVCSTTLRPAVIEFPCTCGEQTREGGICNLSGAMTSFPDREVPVKTTARDENDP
jgi:hypothetical protein